MSLESGPFDLVFGAASIDEFDSVYRLLADNNLPVLDLGDHFGAFIVAKFESTLVGTVGLEVHDQFALLRSLCVADSHRSRRIGAALVSAIEHGASARGVRALYLLTTSADGYFAALGFVAVERQTVPLPIQGTAQFSSLCPASAVCMCKTLEPSL